MLCARRLVQILVKSEISPIDTICYDPCVKSKFLHLAGANIIVQNLGKVKSENLPLIRDPIQSTMALCRWERRDGIQRFKISVLILKLFCSKMYSVESGNDSRNKVR